MSKVVLDITMFLDGFIAGTDEEVNRYTPGFQRRFNECIYQIYWMPTVKFCAESLKAILTV
jgi:hypothetical protein